MHNLTTKKVNLVSESGYRQITASLFCTNDKIIRTVEFDEILSQRDTRAYRDSYSDRSHTGWYFLAIDNSSGSPKVFVPVRMINGWFGKDLRHCIRRENLDNTYNLQRTGSEPCRYSLFMTVDGFKPVFEMMRNKYFQEVRQCNIAETVFALSLGIIYNLFKPVRSGHMALDIESVGNEILGKYLDFSQEKLSFHELYSVFNDPVDGVNIFRHFARTLYSMTREWQQEKNVLKDYLQLVYRAAFLIKLQKLVYSGSKANPVLFDALDNFLACHDPKLRQDFYKRVLNDIYHNNGVPAINAKKKNSKSLFSSLFRKKC
jgi:hypothetical protein